jgi:type I restriction enzyme S subunit
MSFEGCKEFKIGELFDVFSGLSKPREQFGFGHPFLTFKDVFDNYFLPEKLESLANTNEKEIRSCSIKKGDIFLTRTSETQNELGMSSVALKDYDNATFNGFTKRLRLKKDVDVMIDLKYLGYFLRSPYFRNQISEHSSLTTRASLNSTSINSLKIRFPDLRTQTRIGNILKCLDDKMGLNRQTNQTLEAIAQAIFKEWFVDFNFPGATGEMQDSELGEIPKGWKVGKLGDILDIEMGQSPPGSSYNQNKEGIIFFQGKAEFGFRFPVIDKYTTDPKRFANRFDTLLSVRAPVGTINMASERCCIGRGLAAVRGKNGETAFTFYLLKSLQSQFDVFEGSGTVFGSINKSQLEALKIVIPNIEFIRRYEKKIKSIDEMIFNVEEQTKILTQLRDSLLPKLMRGEIQL